MAFSLSCWLPLSGFKARMTYEKCLETRNQTLVRLFDTTVIGVNDLAGDTMGADGRYLNAVLQELPVCDLQQELDNVCNYYNQFFLFVNWTWFVVRLSFEFGLIWCSVCFDDMEYVMAQRWTDGLGNRPGFHHLYRGCQSISIGSSVVCPLLFDAAHARYRFPIRHSRGRHHVYCGSQDFSTCAQRDTHRSVFFNRWREFNRFCSISFFLPMWNAIDCLF